VLEDGLLNLKPGFIYNWAMRTYGPVNLNVLWFLIALNVSLFVITLLRPEALISFLGLNTARLQEHPWTIITSMFVHNPRFFGHILFNMISLYFLGSFLLRAVGERSFLAVFFLGGLAGNILFILLARPFSIGIGASGGIIFPIPIPMPLWVAVLIFLFISFLIPGIAWQAHLGGLLLGLVAGLVFKKRRRMYYF
jgi:membrane associated rhomboid family serine protease